MTARKIRRRALNRGTAVHLGGPRVMFVWPCGCTRTETMDSVGNCSPGAVAKLVRYWRSTGVTLDQCKAHPEWYSKLNQVPRLNAEYPQEAVEAPA